jgi:predicted acylesterase/phospholipase RssA/CRP-like cAMP-binding protein
MREGGPGDALYALVSGRLRVFAEQPDGSQATVGEISAGEVVGEMALLSDDPHSATVKAIRDSQLLEIGRDDFESLGRDEPTVTLAVARLMVARLRRSIHRRSGVGRVGSLAIVPVAGRPLLEGFAHQLEQALKRGGSVSAVSVAAVESELGRDHLAAAPGSAEDLALVAWLNRRETNHDMVVYVADPHLSPWTQRCLRQADRVLLVTEAGGSLSVGEIESGLQGGESEVSTRADLVIVHPAGTSSPTGTARWLADRKSWVHHHVRDNSPGDFDRLARSLSGRAVSLVLSGGGARGLAHIGVMQALEEASIPVDVVGGASFGALMAAVRARGDDAGGVREAMQRFLIDRGSPIDLTAPAAALTGGKRIVSMLRDGFGDLGIEDLWHRFFCVSSNLTKGQLQVHTTGPVWQAVRASISIPGLFPPVNSGDGDVLVDGAVMNNLPVDVIRSLNDGGPVLAVNLRGEFSLQSEDLPHHGVLSGWEVFGKRLNPFAAALELPGLIDVLLRTTEVGSVLSSKSMEQQADLVFHPPVNDVGLLDFSAIDRLIDAGYRHAVEVLEQGGMDQLAI